MSNLRESARIFVSHAHDASPLAELVKQGLNAVGYSSISFSDVAAPGEVWQGALKRAIDDSNVMLFIVSDGYINSEFAQAETASAVSSRQSGLPKALLPVVVDEAGSIPQLLRNRVFLDVSKESNDEDRARRIVDAVQHVVPRAPEARETADAWEVVKLQENYLRQNIQAYEAANRQSGKRSSIVALTAATVGFVAGYLVNLFVGTINLPDASSVALTVMVTLVALAILVAAVVGNLLLSTQTKKKKKKKKKRAKKKKKKGNKRKAPRSPSRIGGGNR